jgi:predicted membrane-bound spermidine synthase
MALLLPIFLLSGFAALLYQVVWQRVLFTIYGIDITSVTVVVTAFMLGLGVGSLVGGALSRRGDRGLIGWFAACEVGIGLFGFCSLDLFAWVASWTLHVPRLLTGVVAFFLVLVPTTLMGASLPLLVEYEARRRANVGRSVGLLYFINTLGAAGGSFAAVLFVLGTYGLRTTTVAAGALNIALGVAVLLLWRRPAAEAAA